MRLLLSARACGN